jgi:hypothetical protein
VPDFGGHDRQAQRHNPRSEHEILRTARRSGGTGYCLNHGYLSLDQAANNVAAGRSFAAGCNASIASSLV